MDYKEKYKMAFERARKNYDVAQDLCNGSQIGVECFKNTLTNIFPELAESEDEKIRKELIDAVQGLWDNDALPIPLSAKRKDAWIAWLEKQGKKVIPKNIDEAALQYVDTCTVDGEVTHDNITEPYWNNHSMMNAYKAGWLEKQGKQEILCDKCKKEQPSHSCQDMKTLMTLDEAIEHCNEKSCDDTACGKNHKQLAEWLTELKGYRNSFAQEAQKPANNVEPEFRNGQWIVWQDKCYKVNYNGCGYELIDQNGLSTSLEYKTVDESAHLWDIVQDAKEGDVLIDKSNNRECPFIFKKTKLSNIKIDCLNPLTVLGYCGIGGAGFTKSEGWGDTANCTYYPATKEQRDLLFKKMREAGYEWDVENKELKKIEQEDEEYNGEDYGIDSLYHAQRILEKTLGEVEGYQSDDGILEHKCAIAAVKKLYKKKPAEWSEEDERNMKNIDSVLFYDKSLSEDTCMRLRNWLKSLKQRIGE